MTKPNILYIIDDDPDDRMLLIEAIKELDPTVECFTAKNGQEGLQNLETNTIPRPSIIFLDLNMPRINGRQFLYKIKNDSALKDIPVIIYTTSSNVKDIDEMIGLGASHYLIKQHNYLVLKESLQAIISKDLSLKPNSNRS